MKKQLSRAMALCVATAGLCISSTFPVMAMVDTDSAPESAIVVEQTVVGIGPGADVAETKSE